MVIDDGALPEREGVGGAPLVCARVHECVQHKRAGAGDRPAGARPSCFQAVILAQNADLVLVFKRFLGNIIQKR